MSLAHVDWLKNSRAEWVCFSALKPGPFDSTLFYLRFTQTPHTSQHKMTRMRAKVSKKKESETTKTDQVSSSERVRDNQRRSRARRKEYIQDLEQRLQKFQSEGIRATREVQEAGRKMAVENGLLRSLLTLHGVSDQRVQEYLRFHTADPHSSRDDAIIRAQSYSRQPPGWDTMNRGKPRPSNYECNDPSPTQMAGEPTPSASSSTPGTYQQVAISTNHSSDVDSEYIDSPIPGISTLQAPRRHGGDIQSGQCTPCETAAGIISSMRSYPDMQDLRSELGCQSSASCMVKNVDIFQLLN